MTTEIILHRYRNFPEAKTTENLLVVKYGITSCQMQGKGSLPASLFLHYVRIFLLGENRMFSSPKF